MNLPKIWPSSGSQEQHREDILRMLHEKGIDTSDAPDRRGKLLQYVAKKERDLYAQNGRN